MATDLERTTRKQDYGVLLEGKERYVIDVAFTETPKPKRQIDILQSPFYCSFKKDLFSQLLGSDAKDNGNPLMTLGLSGKKSDYTFECMEDIQMELYDEKIEDSDSDSDLDENEEMRDLRMKEDFLRKRKRKSTLQLKVLRQEFDKRQGEWSKDKIVKMAELTGLSESQVYKWCWDQKKKNDGPSKNTKSPLRNSESEESEEDENSGLSVPRKTRFIHKDTRMHTKKKVAESCLKT